MCARAGSSTIGARVPSKSSPTIVSAAARTTAAYFCSPSSEVNSMAEAHHTVGWGTYAGPGTTSLRGAGEDAREPVETHRVDRRRRALDAQVEGEELAGP